MPGARVEVVNIATPFELSDELPIEVVPSRKVTVPVGIPDVLEVTVAVKVTGCPTGTGFAEEPSAVVVVAEDTICVNSTVCGWKLVSPE